MSYKGFYVLWKMQLFKPTYVDPWPIPVSKNKCKNISPNTRRHGMSTSLWGSYIFCNLIKCFPSFMIEWTMGRLLLLALLQCHLYVCVYIFICVCMYVHWLNAIKQSNTLVDCSKVVEILVDCSLEINCLKLQYQTTFAYQFNSFTFRSIIKSRPKTLVKVTFMY